MDLVLVDGDDEDRVVGVKEFLAILSRCSMNESHFEWR